MQRDESSGELTDCSTRSPIGGRHGAIFEIKKTYGLEWTSEIRCRFGRSDLRQAIGLLAELSVNLGIAGSIAVGQLGSKVRSATASVEDE